MPLALAVGSITVTLARLPEPPFAVAIALSIDIAVSATGPATLTVTFTPFSVASLLLPANASTTLETVAVAFAPWPARPAIETAFVYASAVDRPFAVRLSDVAETSVAAPANARVMPVTSAVGSITVTEMPPPPLPSARLTARMSDAALTLIGPVATTPAAVVSTPVTPLGAPTNASSLPDTLAAALPPAPAAMPMPNTCAVASASYFTRPASVPAVTFTAPADRLTLSRM